MNHTFKKSFHPAVLVAFIAMLATGCQKGDLTSNPNVSGQNVVGLSPSLLLNHITFSLYKGGGVMESVSGNVSEEPWGNLSHFSQFYLSNYSYYMGINSYNWSNSATQYDGILKYTILMENQAAAQNPLAASSNVYYGLGKFFRAYAFIWLAQRVGDIPMTQAGSATILHPTYDAQKDVYKNSLALLDSANIIIGNLITKNGSGSTVLDAAGDIFGMTYLQWQKVINSYKLRVLISLSKRATDNADLNIPSQFAAIIADPTGHPIFTSNSDNMVFKYVNPTNTYPAVANSAYTGNANICKTYLDLTTGYKDPRTFAVATPAPAQLAAPNNKTISDFTAYVGADPNLSLGQLLNNSNTGTYSFANWNYYAKGNLAGALVEPYILIGYPEMCFTIAEAYNRGWISGTADDVNAAVWYNKGIDASMSLYKGLTQGATYTVGNATGTAYGTVTIDITTFKTNVAYQGGTTGLRQILEQKYVAFFQNSGWEAFYNWRRTGVPSFGQGGPGIGTSSSNIPRRWQYPANEQNENTDNWTKAIQSQFGGTDDITKDTWLTK
jgi:hypothetical protein